MSGSFSQYSVMGNGSISSFGAGGWTANPNTAKSCIMSLANVSGLATPTFSNSNSLGKAGLAREIGLPNYSLSSFKEVTSARFNYDSETVALAGTPNKPSLIYHKGDLTLDGDDGAYQYMNRVIYVEGNITIAGTITPFSTRKFNTISAIPNLTIIATGDIKINSTIKQIEANLISKNGTIDDCAGVSSPSAALSEAGTCKEPFSRKTTTYNKFL